MLRGSLVDSYDDEGFPCSKKAWLAYIAASTLTAYAHFFAALVVAAQCASLIATHPPRMPFRRLFASIGTIGLLTAPLFVFILFYNSGQLAWIPLQSGTVAKAGPRRFTLGLSAKTIQRGMVGGKIQ